MRKYLLLGVMAAGLLVVASAQQADAGWRNCGPRYYGGGFRYNSPSYYRGGFNRGQSFYRGGYYRGFGGSGISIYGPRYGFSYYGW